MEDRESQSTSATLSNEYQPLKKIFKSNQVLKLFSQQLESLPKGMYEVNIIFQKIYILIFLRQNREGEQKRHHQDIESKYVIKVSKSFPLEHSVRIHLLDGPLQPRVSDSRDLLPCIMGKEYIYSMPLNEIVDEIVKFDRKLHSLTENYLLLQRTGVFRLGETYFYHELSEMFSSLTLLKDQHLKKPNVYVGLTETHLLIFKEIADKHQHISLSPLRHHHSLVVKNQQQLQAESEVTYYKLRLISSGELQCIDRIHYSESEKLVRMVMKRYKSIKLYHESEDIKRQYKFLHPEIFLRGILKFITKFQPCEINFQPHFEENKKLKKKMSLNIQSQYQNLSGILAAISKLQEQLKRQQGGGQQKLKIQYINKLYQKLIEYYSARASPYYLIFVNKLNHMYQKHFVSSSKTIK